MPASATGARTAVHQLFVPGRLCLFGEHSDWAAEHRPANPSLAPGFCLVTGTQQGLRANAEHLPDEIEIATVLADGSTRGPFRAPARADSLSHAARQQDFFRYAAGTAAQVVAQYRVGGLRLRITAADLPVGKGLASSAATCVLVARAFNQLYDLGLSWRQEMELAYAGERLTGSACGRMDQICALGTRPALLHFDGPALHVEPLEPRGTLWLLVVDLRRGKDTRRILADLNRCFPDAAGPLAAGVRDALGQRNAALVQKARAAIEAADAATLGTLMGEAQDIFDRFVAPASTELRAPRLHELLAHPAVRDLAHGGKGVGSQGDGCGQIVARGPRERDELAAHLERELGVGCLPQTILPADLPSTDQGGGISGSRPGMAGSRSRVPR